MQVRARMRAANIELGAQPWENARLALYFVDASGAKAGEWSPSIELKRDSDWAGLSQRVDVPTGAVFLKLSPEMLNTSGTLDIDDIQILPVFPAP